MVTTLAEIEAKIQALKEEAKTARKIERQATAQERAAKIAEVLGSQVNRLKVPWDDLDTAKVVITLMKGEAPTYATKGKRTSGDDLESAIRATRHTEVLEELDKLVAADEAKKKEGESRGLKAKELAAYHKAENAKVGTFKRNYFDATGPFAEGKRLAGKGNPDALA